jgi:hypothetical protein
VVVEYVDVVRSFRRPPENDAPLVVDTNEQADYARAFRFDEAGAREEVGHAGEICDEVRRMLTQGGWVHEES